MKNVPKVYWIVMGIVVVVCAILVGVSRYQYLQQNAKITAFGNSITEVKSSKQAQYEIAKFILSSTGTPLANSASASFWGKIKSWFTGRSKAPTLDYPVDQGFNNYEASLSAPVPADNVDCFVDGSCDN